MKKAALGFWIFTLLLYLGLLIKLAFTPKERELIFFATVFTVISILLGGLTWLAWRKIRVRAIRFVVCAGIGYHAFFGPLFLFYMIIANSTRNSDLYMVLYPHVISFIDSFE